MHPAIRTRGLLTQMKETRTGEGTTNSTTMARPRKKKNPRKGLRHDAEPSYWNTCMEENNKYMRVNLSLIYYSMQDSCNLIERLQVSKSSRLVCKNSSTPPSKLRYLHQYSLDCLPRGL